MPNSFKGLHVLVLDTHDDSVRLLRQALAVLGITDIAVADNSLAALKALTVDLYDVVFCDAVIGPIDLWEFSARLRLDSKGRNRRVPIILMTENPQMKLVELARDAGINDVVVRPLSVTAVQRRLQAAMVPKPFVAADNFAGPDRRRKDRREIPGLTQSGKERRYRRRRTDEHTLA
jgi:CheY-like chemotaxis protein